METKEIKALERDIEKIYARIDAANEKMTKCREQMFQMKYSKDFETRPGIRLAYNVLVDSLRRLDKERDQDMLYVGDMKDRLNSLLYGSQCE